MRDRQTDFFPTVASKSLKPMVVLNVWKWVWRRRGLLHTRKKFCFMLGERRDKQMSLDRCPRGPETEALCPDCCREEAPGSGDSYSFTE